MPRLLKAIRWLFLGFASALLVALVAPAGAAEAPIPPSPTAWVTDSPGLLSASTRDALNARLAAYNRATGHQVIVWIGTTTGDAPLEDWTIRAFSAWKVGRKGLDDGLILFLFTQDRKVRIEVGYGLEGQVTDAIASRIARNDIVPALKADDGDGAVTAGIEALLATIGGEQGAQTGQVNEHTDNTEGGITLWEIVLGLIFLLFFLGLLVRSPAWAGWLLYAIASSGRGGGSSGFGGFSGGGFGGFSGGGGMGGGGGASASW